MISKKNWEWLGFISVTNPHHHQVHLLFSLICRHYYYLFVLSFIMCKWNFASSLIWLSALADESLVFSEPSNAARMTMMIMMMLLLVLMTMIMMMMNMIMAMMMTLTIMMMTMMMMNMMKIMMMRMWRRTTTMTKMTTMTRRRQWW